MLVKRKLDVDHGTEGPAHDPYAWTERSVETKHGTAPTLLITHHEGLLAWTKVQQVLDDGSLHTLRETDDESFSYDLFKFCTGLDTYKFDRAYNKIHSRCECGYRGNGHYVDGYPGETFILCPKCGTVMDSLFDESAII